MAVRESQCRDINRSTKEGIRVARRNAQLQCDATMQVQQRAVVEPRDSQPSHASLPRQHNVRRNNIERFTGTADTPGSCHFRRLALDTCAIRNHEFATRLVAPDEPVPSRRREVRWPLSMPRQRRLSWCPCVATTSGPTLSTIDPKARSRELAARKRKPGRR